MERLLFGVLLSGLVLCPVAMAQTTHHVGPGGLPQIRDALAVAAPGDTVLVAPGTYAHFDADVGVTIRPSGVGVIQVEFDPAFPPVPCSSLSCLFTPGQTLLRPPVGQTLHLVGVNFLGNVATIVTQAGSYQARHRVEITSGRVTLDECTITSLDVRPLLVVDATVHLQDCSVQQSAFGSGLPGLTATNSDIVATGSSFTGGSPVGIAVGGFPAPGIKLTNSRLHASGLSVYGGSSTMSSLGAPALLVESGSSAWISDSYLQAGTGACALQHQGTLLRASRCTLVGAGTNCAGPQSGPEMLGVTRTTLLAAGQTFQLDYRTSSNGFVAIFASPSLGTLDAPLVLEQPSWLLETQSFSAALLLADANGDASVSWQIPSGPGISGQELWFKGISGLSFPLQTSAVVGGIAR